MKTKIYYFSATGNSLNAAKRIAGALGDTELISIPKIIKNNTISLDAERVGLIFPVYAWGMPRIVADFVKKIYTTDNPYLFAVATSAGNPAGTMFYLQKFLKLKGIKLNAGLVVNEGNHSFLTNKMPIIRFMELIAGKKSKPMDERFPEIIDIIKNRIDYKMEGNSSISNAIGNIICEKAVEHFSSMDKNYWVDANCDKCGICVKICPRENIKIINNEHHWAHECEFCFACISWCPKSAIQYKKESIGKERSHNANVVLKEFFIR